MKTRNLIGTDFLIKQTYKTTFSIDTILLANYVKVPKNTKRIYEFGTGNGGLLLYLAYKSDVDITGFEIQPKRHDLACENIILNHLEDRVSCLNLDIKDIVARDIDMVVTNPPFFKVTKTSNLNEDQGEMIARHEVLINLEEIIAKASEILKFGGMFYMIHRPERLDEIILLCNRYEMPVKNVCFVHPRVDAKPNHLLITAKRGAKSGIVVDPPIIVWKDENNLTDEMKRMYKTL